MGYRCSHCQGAGGFRPVWGPSFLRDADPKRGCQDILLGGLPQRGRVLEAKGSGGFP